MGSDQGLNVSFDNPAFRAAPSDGPQIHACVLGEPSGQRGSKDPTTGLPGGCRRANILLDNPSAGTASLHTGKVHAEFTGKSPRRFADYAREYRAAYA